MGSLKTKRLIEMKTEMEPNITLNTKRSFLPEHNRLKKFTIPKRTPDKDFLTDCSTNQRDYHEVKERLNQSCFDRECDLGSLWHFDKIEMVHNKDLEEEFVAKRTKMREQGRMDKELSSFLVVSKDEVLKICQSGLCTSNSIRTGLDIMRELGNPQLGVYLFRHVDIALNYASKHSVPVENIIIFRVLLGKVKKIQPPKGRKKVALDPTPNYDCHVSRIHPSLKDSIEDQAIGSLVYIYEYSERSKPVERPRQCLPHAVVKVQCINQNMRADHPVISLKCRPKRFSKGRGRGLLLENCTIVTRIGNSKLIYEHFHKPKNCAVSDNVSVEISALSESGPNWNCSGAETQDSKIKNKLLGRWDSAEVEADVQNFKCMPDVDCNRDAKSDHMGSCNKNPNDTSVTYGELSTIITSKLIKDPRLTKKGKKPGKQNGEPVSQGFSQCENKLKYQTEIKMSATIGTPWPDPGEPCLHNESWHVVSEEQYMAKTSWKDRVSGEHQLPLNSNDECLVNNEHVILNVNQLNRELLDSQSTDTNLAIKSNLSHSSLKSAGSGIKTATQIFSGRDEKVKYSKPLLLGQNENSIHTDSVDSASIGNSTYTHNKEQLVLAPPFQISTCINDLERVVADKDELDGREDMYSQFQEDDGYSSEIQCSASLDSECSKNHCISKGDDETLHSGFHGRMHLPESPMRDLWTGDNICEQSAGDQVHAEIFEQNKLQEMAHSVKSIMNEIPEKGNIRQVLSSSERASDSISEIEENTSKNLEECRDNVKDWMNTSHILDSENSASDFNLNFKEKCSFTESQLTKIESGEEKLSNLSDPALLNKCSGLTTEDNALMLVTSTHVPLGCVKDSEIKHPQFEYTSHSTNENVGALNRSLPQNNSMPEIFEQELEVNSGTEILSEGYKKCVSIPQNLHSHTEVSSEEADTEYQYLQERMDWENLLAKPSPDIEISRSTVLKENKNECSCDEKTDLGEKETKLFNVYVRPDLQITVANTLHTHHGYLKMRTGMGQFLIKRSGQKKEEKRKEEKIEKYTLGQKDSKILHQNKAPNNHCLSEMALPLSKGQFETFEQSEKNIKNVLHTLNTEASFCESKHLSQKINGAMFHLKKAQRNVQKYLKILSKTVKKKRNVSNSHKIELSNLLVNSDCASYNVMSVKEMAVCFTEQKSPNISMLTPPTEMRQAGEKTNNKLESHIESKEETCCTTSFLNDNESYSGALNLDHSVTSAFISDMPFSSNNTIIKVTEHELSEKSTGSDTIELGDTKPASDESSVNSSVVSENNIQEHFSPIMGSAKQELSFKANKNIVTSKNIAEHLNVVVGAEELSICLADLETDACKSNVKTSTVRLATSVEKSSGKLKLSKSGDISKLPPIFTGKDTFSNEKDAGEITAQQNNISVSVGKAQGCDLSHALVPAVKSKHDARDPKVLFTPQIHGSGCKTKTDNQTSPASHEKAVKCHSVLPLRRDSKQGCITAPMISPCAHDNILPKDRRFSSEHSYNCENIISDTRLQIEVEQTALGFIMQMSEILQKADETSCLNVLQEQLIVCKNILPLFIRALEEKQGCSFEHVLVSRENAEKCVQTKLKPCAIESFVELQIIMEAVEFLENKRRYLQGKHTFRSLLWFDDTLCIELFGGQSGYQQQSNFYPAFQQCLKYNALTELQNHHKKIVDKFEITKLENKSYYYLLKLRREIKECEAAVKSNSVLDEFFLSEPYVCGVNYGTTVEDLENARKSIVDLISTYRNHSGTLCTEKLEHLGIIMEIINTKIEFIRTHEGNIKTLFIGLEHIFFNCALSCILKERPTFVNREEGDMLEIYEAALPELYKIFENSVEKLERNFNCASENDILRKSVEQPCSYKKPDGGTNYDIRNYLVSYPKISIGDILDEAQSFNIERLREHQYRCTEQLEVLKKYFQIIQEEDVDDVLITQENVLSFMESSSQRAIRIKPEAIEVYIELAMVHETLCFIQNSLARKENKPRYRSLLWYDLSLVNELFYCQQKMASFSYRKDNLLEIIESAISDVQEELNVVYDYAESLNCSYARQLLTRELEELLETRKYLQMSVSSICMCIDLTPYTIALNYGSNISELEYNYEQFYSLLEKLLLEDRKDLGKMAHIMKILKTIEHMKFTCTKQEKPPLHLVIYQMLKNWRKSRLRKQGDMRRPMDANGSNSMKHKRPAGVTAEDNSCDHEEKNDSSDSKKKKVVASLMTMKKKQEKETCRNMRNSVDIEWSTEQPPERVEDLNL
ncbi:testis-expressed protein 15 isoform X2 [Heteronotia binoei]|uniref:testis-expressed protein 15 isoform X2 n=1 Tax=Heteronotia binoei TaxID=13085 RepID=UPI00292E2ACA|nr:testis-expressed protein 15 isoform X2 [Heteronotia binoei]